MAVAKRDFCYSFFCEKRFSLCIFKRVGEKKTGRLVNSTVHKKTQVC